METLISDLKKVMNSEIEDKDKYMKMLINGFLTERDSELLNIHNVVGQSEQLFKLRDNCVNGVDDEVCRNYSICKYCS